MEIRQATLSFIDHCQSVRKLSSHTMRAYRLDLKGFVDFIGVDASLASCDRALVEQFVKHLFDTRSLKETSVKRHLATLRGFCHWTEDNVEKFQDPFRVAKIRIRVPRRLPRVIPRSELRILLRHRAEAGGLSFDAMTVRVCVEILFATGMRVSELAGLLDSGVNFEEGIITIVGKGNRQRRVFILQEIADVLLEYRRVRDSRNPTATTFLTNTHGNAASPECIRRLIRVHAESAKLPRRITPHMFRHSAATYLLEEGVDIRYVQTLLGHRSISTTEMYTHVADSVLRSRIIEQHPRKRLFDSA